MQCVTCQNEQEPDEEVCPDCNGSGYNERRLVETIETEKNDD